MAVPNGKGKTVIHAKLKIRQQYLQCIGKKIFYAKKHNEIKFNLKKNNIFT